MIATVDTRTKCADRTGLRPRHTILVVDDEPDVLQSLHDLLRRRYKVIGVPAAREGLKVIAQQEVHIVMADQRMPGMSGVEFLSRVRSEHCRAIRLLFTGYADIKAVIDAINLGHVYRYISKPWDAEDLQTILFQAAEHYDLLDQRRQLTEELQAKNAALQEANAELARAYESTLEGWSRALELRDPVTEGHTRRVTEMTLRLARAMGMTEAQLVHVRRGALLHDIGKMGIPDSILLKNGALTEDEWQVMRRHASYAYELLSPIAYLKAALDIPYCHHEKWDGTGYPCGLKGDEIPQAARVFAVVDTWDALRSDRPYRKGWPDERARQHIQSLAGTHFDPKVAERFLKMVD